MGIVFDIAIAILITQPLLVAHAPLSQMPPTRKVAAEYGASRGLFVIKGSTCDTSAKCLILKPSAVNKQLNLKGVKNVQKR
jgi:hypothetical protein